MKLSIFGGGAWGVTLAQVLVENGHEVLIYDTKENMVNKINHHMHPFFDCTIDSKIRATINIQEIKDFSNYYVLAVPSKAVVDLLVQLNPLPKPILFINVSKGLDPQTFLTVGQMIKNYYPKKEIIGYVNLVGPSHAEEVILHKLTLLVAASKNIELAKEVQQIFSNTKYLRVYTSKDVIGTEICASAKNAMAIIGGVISGMPNMGENARAALIVRGMNELLILIKHLGGNKKTVYGLTGLGDLIVTATSNNSRNFRCGLRISKGDTIEEIISEEKQTIEGIRAIEAFYNIGQKYNMNLPIINSAYLLIFKHKDAQVIIKELLTRSLKEE